MNRGNRRSGPSNGAIVAAVIGAVGAVAAAVVTGVLSSGAESPSGENPPAASSAVPTSPGAGGEAISAAATTSPRPVVYGDPSNYRLDLSPGVAVDVDTRTATAEGGAGFEFYYKGDLNHDLFFGKSAKTFGRSKVVLVSLDQASPRGCEASTRVQTSGRVSGYMMKAGDAICVSTSDGAWAVLDVLAWGDAGAVDVTLWPVRR
ncbi:hypothetical protein SAMN05192558_101472 [Actinokineospora alba]|uniref:Uncharacterized protein n=1 Tax=Actinokineospora alba TaxID=504798 RepID=A0A1H0FQS4_9PSEU|nr:hypothetical protein C8E96_5168 [Actinokineospora alba]SDI13775.1 hypothetical protein SAMN05421871_103399 [Actinokineospora alba]SDN97016.1 hypothetical protein SAMN05192558_101472 [Actinokineospora alba]